MTLAAYSLECKIARLSPYQIDLISKIISAVTPIEEITQSVSTNAASVSAIISSIQMLKKTLSNTVMIEAFRQ